MARVILGVTGSVAATRAPVLFHALNAAGHEVRVVFTNAAMYFLDRAEFDRPSARLSATVSSNATPVLFSDGDEWPRDRYERGDPVLHIEFRKWADLLVVAPLDANTLAKFAIGLSDNFLSCLFRAWDFKKPVILAPAMNTLMWESRITLRHLRQIFEDQYPAPISEEWSLMSAHALFERYLPQMVIVSPQAKRLACGDVGMGAMADVEAIADVVAEWQAIS